ncbi:MAG: hypothetical protein JWQ23_3948 [Herminiimonas sp.]|nr:hypothetical protein [Herminiimonas sp.]
MDRTTVKKDSQSELYKSPFLWHEVPQKSQPEQRMHNDLANQSGSAGPARIPSPLNLTPLTLSPREPKLLQRAKTTNGLAVAGPAEVVPDVSPTPRMRAAAPGTGSAWQKNAPQGLRADVLEYSPLRQGRITREEKPVTDLPRMNLDSPKGNESSISPRSPRILSPRSLPASIPEPASIQKAVTASSSKIKNCRVVNMLPEVAAELANQLILSEYDAATDKDARKFKIDHALINAVGRHDKYIRIPDGDPVSVHGMMAAYIRAQFNDSPIKDAIENVLVKLFERYGAKPQKLKTIQGKADDPNGQTSSPDAELLKPYTTPLLECIFGTKNNWQHSPFPRKAIDALVKIDLALVRLCLQDQDAQLDVINQVRTRMLVQFVVTRTLGALVNEAPIPYKEESPEYVRFAQVRLTFSTHINKNLNYELSAFLTSLINYSNGMLTRAERQDLFRRVPNEVRQAAVQKKVQTMTTSSGAKSRFIFTSAKPVSPASQLRGFKEWLEINSLPDALENLLIEEIEKTRTAKPDFDILQAVCLRAVFRHQREHDLTADERKIFLTLMDRLAGPAYFPNMKHDKLASQSTSSSGDESNLVDITDHKAAVI